MTVGPPLRLPPKNWGKENGEIMSRGAKKNISLQIMSRGAKKNISLRIRHSLTPLEVIITITMKVTLRPILTILVVVKCSVLVLFGYLVHAQLTLVVSKCKGGVLLHVKKKSNGVQVTVSEKKIRIFEPIC